MAFDAQRLAVTFAADGEFCLAARFWNGALVLDLGGEVVAFTVTDGVIAAAREPTGNGPGSIVIAGPAPVWDALLAPVPPPYFNDVIPALALGLELRSDTETFWQYYPAVRRAIDLLREER